MQTLLMNFPAFPQPGKLKEALLQIKMTSSKQKHANVWVGGLEMFFPLTNAALLTSNLTSTAAF